MTLIQLSNPEKRGNGYQLSPDYQYRCQ